MPYLALPYSPFYVLEKHFPLTHFVYRPKEIILRFGIFGQLQQPALVKGLQNDLGCYQCVLWNYYIAVKVRNGLRREPAQQKYIIGKNLGKRPRLGVGSLGAFFIFIIYIIIINFKFIVSIKVHVGTFHTCVPLPPI